jgi:hypothetical protein
MVFEIFLKALKMSFSHHDGIGEYVSPILFHSTKQSNKKFLLIVPFLHHIIRMEKTTISFSII